MEAVSPLGELWEFTNGFLEIPELPSVCEWAQQNIYLSAKGGTAAPQFWSLDRTPWAKEIMEFPRSNKKELVLVLGTQMGKSTMIFAMLGYHLIYKRRPAKFVYPTEAMAKRVVNNRWYHFVHDSPALLAELVKWTIPSQEFRAATSDFVGSGGRGNTQESPVSLGALDEVGNVDKGKVDLEQGQVDTGAVASMEARTSEDPDGKLILTGTPKSYDDILWTRLMKTNCNEQWVPSPHVDPSAPFEKRYFIFDWKHIKYTEHRDDDGNLLMRKTLDTVVYHCPHTNKPILDRDKKLMSQQYKWVAKFPEADPEKEGYHANAFCMSKYSWRDFVKQYLLLKDEAGFGEAQFFNGMLALPYQNEKMSATQEMILNLTKGLKNEDNQWIVPPYERKALMGDIRILSADAQADRFYWVVIGYSATSKRAYLIDWGVQPSMGDLAKLYVEYKCKSAVVDEGDGERAPEIRADVYVLRKDHKQNWKTIKGFAHIQSGEWQQPQEINAYRGDHTGMQTQKNMITLLKTDKSIWVPELARLRSRDKQGLFFPKEIDDLLLKHMMSVNQITYKDSRGKMVSKFTEDEKNNHLWDAMTYNLSDGSFNKVPLFAVAQPKQKVVTGGGFRWY